VKVKGNYNHNLKQMTQQISRFPAMRAGVTNTVPVGLF